MSIAALPARISAVHVQTEQPAQGMAPVDKSDTAEDPTRTEGRASIDPVAELIKQMQERLRQVMMQIQRLEASKIPAEQKMQRLRALNEEATQLQQQISEAQQRALRASRGGITA